MQSPILSDQKGIVLTLRRRFFLVRLPAAVLCAAASLLVVFVGRSVFEKGIGCLGLGLFTAMFLIGLRRSFDARPQYWINAEGIYCMRSAIGLIAWEEIEAAAVMEVHRQQFLCLYLENPERVLSRLPRLQRWLKQMNQGMGFGSFSFALGSFDVSPAEIQAYLTRHVPGPDGVDVSDEEHQLDHRG